MRTGSALGVTSWSIGTKMTNFKIFLLWRWKANSFDIWYVASTSRPLPSLSIWCPWGQNWPRPGGHMLEHRNKDSKLQNSSSLKLEDAELRYLVCSISLWTCYQVCSYDAPGVNTGSTPRVTRWNIGTKQANFKIFPLWNFLACVLFRVHIFSPIIMEVMQNVCLDEILDDFENVHVGSKTRSQVQILEKTCVCSRGLIFSPIIIKLGQNVFIDKILVVFENGSFWVKN